jgi:hypothetical protein
MLVMRAFEISLNGKKLCVAGLDQGMLLFGMNCTENKNGRGEVGLYMTGPMLLRQVNVSWQQRRLRMNHEILVRAETDKADKYKILEETPHDPRKYEKAYVRWPRSSAGRYKPRNRAVRVP